MGVQPWHCRPRSAVQSWHWALWCLGMPREERDPSLITVASFPQSGDCFIYEIYIFFSACPFPARRRPAGGKVTTPSVVLLKPRSSSCSAVPCRPRAVQVRVRFILVAIPSASLPKSWPLRSSLKLLWAWRSLRPSCDREAASHGTKKAFSGFLDIVFLARRSRRSSA